MKKSSSTHIMDNVNITQKINGKSGLGLRIKDELLTHYIYIILLLFWIISSAASPFFRTMDTFANIFVVAVPLALIGLGQTLVVLSRGFDLSVGAVASMATAVASVTMVYGVVPSVILIIIIAAIIGTINGLGITKLQIDPFIMTLCMMFFLTGVNFIIRPTSGGLIPDGYKNFLLYSVNSFPIVAVLILIIVALVGYIILKRRRFGRSIYAVGGEPNYAKMSGINIDLVRIETYIVSAVASALGGLFLAARIGSGNAAAGSPYLFDSFIVVFMGGTLVTGGVGGYAGTLGAALLISSIGQILQFLGVNIWWQYIIKGALLVSVAGIQLYVAKKRRTV